MPPIRSSRSQFTIGRLMVVVAVLAGLLGMAMSYPGLAVMLLFVGIYVFTLIETRPEKRGTKPDREPRQFRFSIWQIMAVSAVVAVLLGIIRTVAALVFPDSTPGGPIRSFLMASGALIVGLVCLAGLSYLLISTWSFVRLILFWSKGERKENTMFGLSRKEQREKLRLKPFPPGWSKILDKNVPIYGRLSETDRAELRGLIQVFIAEKIFEGCSGQEITDEIRVTIAAQACLLLLHRETDIYPKLITILVYPSAYVSNVPQHGPHGIVTEGPQGRLGEAWTSGVVVLSWDDVKLGAADVRDGQNVVFHEFAHQLDQEDGSSDGAPILPSRNLYSAWARVLGEEYAELQKAAETGKKSVLDTYGATEPAEFFAVATEAFFEKPVQLKKKHPELYEELKIYYGQDPEAEFAEPGPSTRPKL